MSLQLTLYRVPEAEISQLIFNLEQEEFEKITEENEPFFIEGVGKIIYFLLTGSLDFTAAWFDPSPSFIDEILEPDGKILILIDLFAAGKKLGRTTAYLTTTQVKEATRILSDLACENLEQRWERLAQFNRLKHEKVIGKLVNIDLQKFRGLTE